MLAGGAKRRQRLADGGGGLLLALSATTRSICLLTSAIHRWAASGVWMSIGPACLDTGRLPA